MASLDGCPRSARLLNTQIKAITLIEAFKRSMAKVKTAFFLVRHIARAKASNYSII